MKTLKCRDAGFNCDAEIHADNDAEILKQAAAHAKEVHHVEVTPEMAEQIKSLITEDRPVS